MATIDPKANAKEMSVEERLQVEQACERVPARLHEVDGVRVIAPDEGLIGMDGRVWVDAKLQVDVVGTSRDQQAVKSPALELAIAGYLKTWITIARAALHVIVIHTQVHPLRREQVPHEEHAGSMFPQCWTCSQRYQIRPT